MAMDRLENIIGRGGCPGKPTKKWTCDRVRDCGNTTEGAKMGITTCSMVIRVYRSGWDYVLCQGPDHGAGWRANPLMEWCLEAAFSSVDAGAGAASLLR
jgi:hypothetical protein